MRAITGTGPSGIPAGNTFKDAETLIDDFFNEVESVLRERGIGMTVVRVEDIRRRK